MLNVSRKNLEEVSFDISLDYQDTKTHFRMIAENIDSALVMESDADWDLRIKEILQGVASASKRLLDWPFDAQTRPGIFPYGDKWDIIWIGTSQ